MQVYVNNIVKDPANPKYRKIRISKLMFTACYLELGVLNWKKKKKKTGPCNMDLANIICLRPFCTVPGDIRTSIGSLNEPSVIEKHKGLEEEGEGGGGESEGADSTSGKKG